MTDFEQQLRTWWVKLTAWLYRLVKGISARMAPT